jgi:regulator of sirC expression with transglutaminase-like and TPR domain
MTSTILPVTRSAPCCRAEAYAYFCEQLPNLNSTRRLLRAAIAVSMHALDDVDASRVEQRLEVLSLRVRERAPSRSIRALQANLHAVLFDEEGFQGDMERYYSALNSYLPAVINTRRGLPVVLALIYKVVGEWAGLRVEGVNAPGHFMVRVRYENSWMIVDPFFGGQVLHREEAFERLDRVASQKLPRDDEMLARPTHAQWLARLIGNLRQLFETEQRHEDLAAMNEFMTALQLSEQQRRAPRTEH